MQYKFYHYTLENEDGWEVPPDDHWGLFESAISTDDSGMLATYRGQPNAVLMHLRQFRSDFSGLVGKHSTEREITSYNELVDETESIIVDDNDYPHTPFVCMPRLKIIACVDSAKIHANSAMARLHVILGHRTKCNFVIESIRESQDLRKAISRFKITEVSFEVLPVNPHTGTLGQLLNDSRALDHIQKIKGKAEATEASPLKLAGGFLSQIQELQQSGHAKIGYKGVADFGVLISVSKPDKALELEEDEENVAHGENLDVKVDFPRMRISYPFQQAHITQVRTIARRFLDEENEQ